MQKFNEKALILEDACRGLMTKLAFHRERLEDPQSRPTCFTTDTWAKIRKGLEKSFPEVADITVVKGYDTFRPNAASICDALQPMYLTLVDMSDLMNASKLLLAMALASTATFRLEQNRCVIQGTMQLFTRIAQLHFFLEAYSERKMVVVLYAAAHQCVHRQADPQARPLAHFVAEFDEPHRRLIQQMEEIQAATPLSDLCLSLRPCIDAYLDTEGLRRNNMLNPTDEAGGLALPVRTPLSASQSKLSLHAEMRDADRYLIWVALVGLACPELLVHPDRHFLPLFNTVTRMSLEVPIFRALTLTVHTTTEELGKWFPPRNYRITPPKDLKSLKKLFKEESKAATQSCAHAHAEKRSYLRGEMGALVALFTDTPGLLGPKFPMVLAALAMAKAELVWFYTHKMATTRKDRLKHLHLDHFEDPFISALLGLQDRLTQLVAECRPLIQTYYIEYLQGAHRTRLAGLLAAARPHLGGENTAVTAILESFLPAIDALDPSHPESADLAGFRLDVARCAASFTALQSASGKRETVVALLEGLDKIACQARYVDDIDGLLVEYAEMSELWWFNDHLLAEFERALNDSVELNKAGFYNGLHSEGVAQHVIAYIRAAGAAMDNISGFCPEEQKTLAAASSQYCEDLMGAVARRVRDLVDPLSAQLLYYNDYLQPVQAAYRLQRIQDAKAKNQEINKELPGWESQAFRLEYVKDLVITERNLNRILSVVHATPRIVVNDRVFAPKEFVRRELRRYCAQCVGAAFTGAAEGLMAPPSMALRRVNALVGALQHAASHIPMDVQAMVRETLFFQSLDTKYYTPLDATPNPGGDADGGKMVHRLADFYVGLVRSIVPGDQNSGVCFVELQNAFVRINGGEGVLDAERFTDAAELEALCTLLGAHGIRVVEGKLLAFVASQVDVLKRFMVQNMSSLERFRSTYHGTQWAAPVRQMAGLETFMNSSILIGNALCLRRLLHDALRRVQRQRVPFLAEAAQIARSAVLDAYADVSELESMDFLGQDCGVESPLSDARLRAAIAHVSHGAEPNVWALLPYAWAATLLCNQWTQTAFVASLDVFTLNEHVLAVTIRKLIICLQPARSMVGVNASGLQDAFRSYMKVSSFVLLRMKMYDGLEFTQFPLRAMTLLLEKFVQECPFLERSMLENFMPYAILHNCYMDIALHKQRASDVPMSCHQAFGS